MTLPVVLYTVAVSVVVPPTVEMVAVVGATVIDPTVCEPPPPPPPLPLPPTVIDSTPFENVDGNEGNAVVAGPSRSAPVELNSAP
jgi:hypothetical protein